MRTPLALAAAAAITLLALPTHSEAQLGIERPPLETEGLSLEFFAAYLPGGPVGWGIQVRGPDGMITPHRFDHSLTSGQFGGVGVRYELTPRLRLSGSLAAAYGWQRGMSVDPRQTATMDLRFSEGSLLMGTAGAEVAVVRAAYLRLWAGAGATVLHQDPDEVQVAMSGGQWVVRPADALRRPATSPAGYLRAAMEIPISPEPGLSLNLAADHNWIRWDRDALLSGIDALFAEAEPDGDRHVVHAEDVFGSSFFVFRIGLALHVGDLDL